MGSQTTSWKWHFSPNDSLGNNRVQGHVQLIARMSKKTVNFGAGNSPTVWWAKNFAITPFIEKERGGVSPRDPLQLIKWSYVVFWYNEQELRKKAYEINVDCSKCSITQNGKMLDTIALLPFNPGVGSAVKGHVRGWAKKLLSWDSLVAITPFRRKREGGLPFQLKVQIRVFRIALMIRACSTNGLYKSPFSFALPAFKAVLNAPAQKRRRCCFFKTNHESISCHVSDLVGDIKLL